MERQEIILDSVKKLLALNVLDEEILLNLQDVGLSKDDAQKILDRAKQSGLEKKVAVQVEADSGKVLMDVAESLEKSRSIESEAEKRETDEMAAQIVGEEVEKGLKVFQKKAFEEKKPIFLRKNVVEKNPAESPVNLNKLWEKGILITVNQKFNEMKKMKEELDSIVLEKTQAVSEKEMQKIKVLFDSQKTLFLEKIDSRLEEKGDEITRIIDSKIFEMKKLNDDTKKTIVEIDLRRQKYDKTISEIEAKLSELQALKQKISAELNAELLKSKSSMQEFLDSAEEKIQELDERVSRTLELESKIADGLVKDAEEKIDNLSIEKAGELEKQIEPLIEEIQSIAETAKPERVDAALAKISEKMHELEQSYSEASNQISSKNAKFDQKIAAISEKLQELDKAKEKASDNAELQNAKQLISDLDAFKNQFIQIIEANVKKNNSTVKELNEQAKKAEEQVSLRIKTIDQKISELDDFEKTFSEEIGTLLEEMQNQKKK